MKLSTSFQLGAFRLAHRVVMPPLTRMRSANGVPSPLAATYYGQRATEGGLIIAEATQISQQGQGYPRTPGIYTEDQIAGWRTVVDAVKERGGVIFLQLWHVGRISHSSFQKDGAVPVAPSAIRPAGNAFKSDFQRAPYETPRALELSEIVQIVADYRKAAENAKRAGFDGIEIHAANGYLLDQFIESSTNRRSDAYGGTVQNRVRLLLEITEALIPILGADRIGVRLSPLGKMNDISDDAPESTFGYLAEQLSGYGLAYLHIVNPALEQMQNGEKPEPYALSMARLIRNKYQGTLIVAGGFNADSATQWLRDGQADLIAFGRKFIANPDLPERLRVGAPLNVDNPKTYYGGGENGYTDYPSLEQDRGEKAKACVDQRWR